MDSTVIIAAFSFLGVVCSGIISALVSMSLVNWRLKEIEKRLDNHNHYASLFAQSSTDLALIKQEIKYIKDKVAEIK